MRCLRQGEYNVWFKCIVGYVRFRLHLEAILESKALLFSSANLFRPSEQEECFWVMLAKICKEVGLLLVQDSMQYSDRVCNPCGWRIWNLGQLYHFIKAAIISRASTLVKSGRDTLDTPDKASPAWRKSKSVHVNLPVVKSPSIEGSTSATEGKSRKSLSFSPLEKIKEPKSLI